MLIFFQFSLVFSSFFPTVEIIFGLISFQDSFFYTVIAIDGSLG